MKKLDYVDSLRGLAILCVIMIHTNQFGNSSVPIILRKIIGEGARGVQLFYLASAFTLFLSFKNRCDKEKFPVRNFFIRRLFRIAPLYYLGIVYYIFQDGLGSRYWLGSEPHITVLNIISNFTFLHAFNPFWINSLVPGGWSIGVEMTFYAIFPLLFLKIKSLNQAFIFFIISILLRLLLQLEFEKFPLIMDSRLWNEYLFLYFPSQMPVFALGIILYFIIIENETSKAVSGKLIILMCGLMLVQLTLNTPYFFPHHILFGIGFLGLGIALSKFRFMLFVNPVINYIGRISFSMYLVHFAVLHWLAYYHFIDFFENGTVNYLTRLGLVFGLTVLLSGLLYRAIEIPFQRMGKKMILRLEGTQTD